LLAWHLASDPGRIVFEQVLAVRSCSTVHAQGRLSMRSRVHTHAARYNTGGSIYLGTWTVRN
jgi:hypothetical protein